jgi:folylpolyglutamate synthase/dihydropteroate synthase
MKKPRSLPAEELQTLCREYLRDTECVVVPSVEDAAAAAKAEAGAADTIVVFGSLSHLETARKALIE